MHTAPKDYAHGLWASEVAARVVVGQCQHLDAGCFVNDASGVFRVGEPDGGAVEVRVVIQEMICPPVRVL